MIARLLIARLTNARLTIARNKSMVLLRENLTRGLTRWKFHLVKPSVKLKPFKCVAFYEYLSNDKPEPTSKITSTQQRRIHCVPLIHTNGLGCKLPFPKLLLHAILNPKIWNTELWMQWMIGNSTIYPTLSKTCFNTPRMNLSLCPIDPQWIFVLEINSPQNCFSM